MTMQMCALLASMRATVTPITRQSGPDEHHLDVVEVLFESNGDFVAVVADGVLHRLIGFEQGVFSTDVLQERCQVGLAGDLVPKDNEGIAGNFGFLGHGCFLVRLEPGGNASASVAPQSGEDGQAASLVNDKTCRKEVR